MRLLLLAGFLSLAASLFGQSASLQADSRELNPAGGEIALTAVTTYEGELGALGWEIQLPAGWRLARLSGPNAPAVASPPGTMGTLEFAFAQMPPARTAFLVHVAYPPQAAAGVVSGTALLRAHGKLTTLKPEPVDVRPAVVNPGKRREL